MHYLLLLRSLFFQTQHIPFEDWQDYVRNKKNIWLVEILNQWIVLFTHFGSTIWN